MKPEWTILNQMSLRKVTLLLISLFLAGSPFAQNWQWANRVGSDIDNQVNTESGNGFTDGINYYLMGKFPSNLFTNTTTLHSDGDEWDNYLIKYDSNGQELWAKNLKSGWESWYAGAIFNQFNQRIYIGGTFYGTWVLGSDTLISNFSAPSIFLSQLDLEGNILWAKAFSGKHYSGKFFNKPNGNIFLIGWANGQATFDTIPFIGGGFISEFSNEGICQMVKGNGIITSGRQKVVFLESDFIVASTFSSSITYNNLEFNPKNLDGFIARLDSIGNVKWLKTISGLEDDWLTGLSKDSLDNIYLSGSFTDSALIFNNSMVYNAGTDVFFSKLDQNGNLIWFKQIHNSGSEVWSDLSQIRNGEFYATGRFSGSASFGNFYLESSSPQDMFLARYDTTGKCLAVTHFGEAWGLNVNFDNNGDIFCNGYFWNSVSIGANQFTAYSWFDNYVAKSGPINRMETPKNLEDESLHIYSNPTTGVCTIEVPQAFQNERKLVLSVFDSTGRKVTQKAIDMLSSSIQFDLYSEAKGIYQITLSNYQKTYSGRVVFQ